MELTRIRQLNDEIREEILRISEIRSEAFPGAIRYDTIGGSHGTPENLMENVIATVDIEQRKARLMIDLRRQERAEAIRIIRRSDLTIAQRHILYLRYLARHHDWTSLGWPEVYHWVNLYHNVERSRMFELHADAMRKIKKLFAQ